MLSSLKSVGDIAPCFLHSCQKWKKIYNNHTPTSCWIPLILLCLFTSVLPPPKLPIRFSGGKSYLVTTKEKETRQGLHRLRSRSPAPSILNAGKFSIQVKIIFWPDYWKIQRKPSFNVRTINSIGEIWDFSRFSCFAVLQRIGVTETSGTGNLGAARLATTHGSILDPVVRHSSN